MAVESVTMANPGVKNLNQPAFKGKPLGHVEVKEYPDHFEKRTTVEASTGKKWGVGIASAFLSGLGQFINGDIGKGFAFLGAMGAAIAGNWYANMKGNTAARVATMVLGLGSNTWSIVDAVKNAKSTVTNIEQKK